MILIRDELVVFVYIDKWIMSPTHVKRMSCGLGMVSSHAEKESKVLSTAILSHLALELHQFVMVVVDFSQYLLLKLVFMSLRDFLFD